MPALDSSKFGSLAHFKMKPQDNLHPLVLFPLDHRLDLYPLFNVLYFRIAHSQLSKVVFHPTHPPKTFQAIFIIFYLIEFQDHLTTQVIPLG